MHRKGVVSTNRRYTYQFMKNSTQLRIPINVHLPPELYRQITSYLPFSVCFVCNRKVTYAEGYHDIYLCSVVCRSKYCVVAGFWYMYYLTGCLAYMIAYHTAFLAVHVLFIGLWLFAVVAQISMGCYIMWKSWTFVAAVFS